MAYQVILKPGMGQFREFEPPRVRTRINSWGLFLVHKLTCKKRESVSWLATLDEKSTSSGIAEPYAPQKLKGRTGAGGREGTTPVTTACPEAGK